MRSLLGHNSIQVGSIYITFTLVKSIVNCSVAVVNVTHRTVDLVVTVVFELNHVLHEYLVHIRVGEHANEPIALLRDRLGGY